MSRENLIIDFVTKVMNEDNRYNNATVYDDGFFEKAIHQKVTINRGLRSDYNKLIQFCIDNNLTIISTNPATLSTVVRIDL